MKYRVDFFKASGKWYTGEEVVLPEELVRKADEYISKEEWGKAIYETRQWVANHIKYDLNFEEMHAVVIPPEGDDYIAYPMMIPTSDRR
jgi:hypothetical protein